MLRWLAASLVVFAIVALFAANRRAEPLPFGADEIVIHKRAHTMDLMHAGAVMRGYRVAIGRGGLAPKEREGDMLVPEGEYHIIAHNPQSAYHQALRISYPTDAQAAAARGQGIHPGGDIMIHGIRNGMGWLGSLHRLVDWTMGCVAVTDPEINEIVKAVPDGTRVLILP